MHEYRYTSKRVGTIYQTRSELQVIASYLRDGLFHTDATWGRIPESSAFLRLWVEEYNPDGSFIRSLEGNHEFIAIIASGDWAGVNETLQLPPGRRIFQSVPEFVASWARRNGCAAAAVESQVAADVTRIAYPECEDAPVTLYRIEDGGHVWPGGGHIAAWFVGRSTSSIDASNVMWNFFKDHPLKQGA